MFLHLWQCFSTMSIANMGTRFFFNSLLWTSYPIILHGVISNLTNNNPPNAAVFLFQNPTSQSHLLRTFMYSDFKDTRLTDLRDSKGMLQNEDLENVYCSIILYHILWQSHNSLSSWFTKDSSWTSLPLKKVMTLKISTKLEFDWMFICVAKEIK